MPNKSLVQLIKQCAMEAVAASRPCDSLVGTVRQLNPLEVSVGQKIILDKDFLNVTVTAGERMEEGSKVILIRSSGGQRYTVMDVLI